MMVAKGIPEPLMSSIEPEMDKDSWVYAVKHNREMAKTDKTDLIDCIDCFEK